MNKKIILIVGIIALVGIFFWVKSSQPKQTNEQVVLEKTLEISKEYTSLRYKTDNVLVNAKEYADYDKWNNEMSNIVKEWGELENSASDLEKLSNEITEEKVGFVFVNQIMAYTKEEVTSVIDKAPMGKKIMTLANHLGVDAKMAQLILNETQNMISREAYGEEGDVMATCEQGAMRVKNGAKVTVFVGTIVVTGGTSALAASGTLAQTAVVVSGADLALEVTEDEARIALGDKNKVTEYVSNIRSVTEPAASILTLASIPGNLSKAGEKFAAVNFAADQVRSSIQDKKILGISIKSNDEGGVKAEISGLTETELVEWKKENNVVESNQTVEEIIKQIEVEAKEEKPTEVPKEENKKETPKTKSENIPNQIIKVKNVSGSSWMIDTCFTSTCWDDLDADPKEDRDLGGIYTLGKVFSNGEGFSKQFQVAQFRDNGRLVETSANRYKITLYFAMVPFEGSKNKTIDYGTWLSESVEINANYGDEPVIEWDGSSLKQVQ
jgi:hypothetical protein